MNQARRSDERTAPAHPDGGPTRPSPIGSGDRLAPGHHEDDPRGPGIRVIVVGAGFAGLVAADRLAQAGVEVVVLEARDRVGGRVHSHTLPNGAVVEMGAEFILPGYDVLTGLVERFGLGLWTKGMRYGIREPRGGPPVTSDALRSALETVQRSLAARRANAPPRSAQALLGELDIHPAAREVVLARVEVSSASPADRVDASVLAGLAAHADDVSPSVAGGNQRIAHALAGALDGGVRLGEPVVAIRWRDDGVLVRTREDEFDADAAVVAIPASVVDQIEFEPALPEATGAAIAATAYGHAAKLFVPLREPAPPSAVLSVPERYWTWTATGADGVVQPAVSAFAGSARALATLEVDRGPSTWLASLARLRPDLALDGDGAVLSTWDDDPWVRAAYSTVTIGRRYHDLTRPVGALRFCGEHTDRSFPALMEGALRSGLRAAADVLAAAAA